MSVAAPEGEKAPSFDEWMERVDGAVWRMASGAHDLPDYDYQTLFESGALPAEAPDESLIAADFSRFEYATTVFYDVDLGLSA